MALTATEYKHIQLDENGNAIIANSSMKVVELITSHLTYGWSPEELHFQYPHIRLSQVYSALSYYWDHQAALDAEMQRRFAEAEILRKKITCREDD
ncbi:MAG: DUF433 domain-containing protein [Thainema sp.]